MTAKISTDYGFKALESSWLKALEKELKKPYIKNLEDFLNKEAYDQEIYPVSNLTFNAFKLCPLEQIKVVILGQDPYHGVNQAHGLCFSVPEGVAMPPSLINIFKELERDLHIPIPKNGNLERWARQGVFLLNTVLSVRAGQANSHAGQGWEIFTDKVIELINQHSSNTVFMLWGTPARRKSSMIDKNKHLVLETVHPSPLSAYRGFLGCGHFSHANDYLIQHGKTPIEW
ncbi:MAG: uracil-DNA glycosylase [Cyanobacteriota bacterium]|jgi:uracil-DNA glycosylase